MLALARTSLIGYALLQFMLIKKKTQELCTDSEADLHEVLACVNHLIVYQPDSLQPRFTAILRATFLMKDVEKSKSDINVLGVSHKNTLSRHPPKEENRTLNQ